MGPSEAREKGKSLYVYIGDAYAGRLMEDRHGSLSFEYDEAYRGVPLSLSMPTGLARYHDRTVRPYLEGLLPDDANTREKLGEMFGVSGNNPFRLLGGIGNDCPGAIRMRATREDGGRQTAGRHGGELVELTEADIERRLRDIREDAARAWTEHPREESRWSLAGCQAKFAVRLRAGRWYACLGDEATTHLVKPGIAGLPHQALVEYLTMRCAANIGLPVAKTDYRLFGVEPAIVIARYDRVQDRYGNIRRLHQEDLCQALGVSPQKKYAEDGGPSSVDVFEVLAKTGQNASDNLYRFVLYLFFNYLMGATDAHAKNYSVLLLGERDVRLAPLYDVASMAPYADLSPERRKPIRTAMSIGGENRFGMVERKHIEKMVSTTCLSDFGFEGEMLSNAMHLMAERIPPALDAAINELKDSGLASGEDVVRSMVHGVRAICSRTTERL